MNQTFFLNKRNIVNEQCCEDQQIAKEEFEIDHNKEIKIMNSI